MKKSRLFFPFRLLGSCYYVLVRRWKTFRSAFHRKTLYSLFPPLLPAAGVSSKSSRMSFSFALVEGDWFLSLTHKQWRNRVVTDTHKENEAVTELVLCSGKLDIVHWNPAVIIFCQVTIFLIHPQISFMSGWSLTEDALTFICILELHYIVCKVISAISQRQVVLETVYLGIRFIEDKSEMHINLQWSFSANKVVYGTSLLVSFLLKCCMFHSSKHKSAQHTDKQRTWRLTGSRFG